MFLPQLHIDETATKYRQNRLLGGNMASILPIFFSLLRSYDPRMFKIVSWILLIFSLKSSKLMPRSKLLLQFSSLQLSKSFKELRWRIYFYDISRIYESRGRSEVKRWRLIALCACTSSTILAPALLCYDTIMLIHCVDTSTYISAIVLTHKNLVC